MKLENAFSRDHETEAARVSLQRRRKKRKITKKSKTLFFPLLKRDLTEENVSWRASGVTRYSFTFKLRFFFLNNAHYESCSFFDDGDLQNHMITY